MLISKIIEANNYDTHYPVSQEVKAVRQWNLVIKENTMWKIFFFKNQYMWRVAQFGTKRLKTML